MVEFLAFTIKIVFDLLWWAILIRVLLSFVPMLGGGVSIDPMHPIVRLLHSITDPLLEPLRPYLTVQMMDFSPIVVLIGLQVVQSMLLSLLGVAPNGGGF